MTKVIFVPFQLPFDNLIFGFEAGLRSSSRSSVLKSLRSMSLERGDSKSVVFVTVNLCLFLDLS